MTLDGEAVSGNADDGPAGDRDLIDQDVEGIFGGAGGDMLTGSARRKPAQRRTGPGSLHGAGGFDVADYSERTSGVTVRLDGSSTSGNADDGHSQARDSDLPGRGGHLRRQRRRRPTGSAAENMIDAGQAMTTSIVATPASTSPSAGRAPTRLGLTISTRSTSASSSPVPRSRPRLDLPPARRLPSFARGAADERPRDGQGDAQAALARRALQRASRADRLPRRM